MNSHIKTPLTIPSALEVREALRVIARAEQAVAEKMTAAGLPRASCSVTEGIVRNVVAVHLRSSERVFMSDGKVNCQSGYANYDRIDHAIEEAANNLQIKKGRRK